MRIISKSTMLLAVVAAIVGRAQNTPPTPPEKPAAIEGSVANSVTGEPVPRAHVTLRHDRDVPRTYGALTGPDGKFSVTAMEPGDYMVMAERAGFVTFDPNQPRTEQVSLSPGTTKTEVKLKLTPNGTILGRVLDSDGEPIDSINVAAVLNGNQHSSDTSDEKGNFRLGGLAPGKYRVRAQPATAPYPPDIRSDGTTEIHYRSTYYPSLPDEAGAGQIEVAAGAETAGVEIRLIRSPIVRVSGVIVGLPPTAENVGVTAQSGNHFSGGGQGVKPDGKFQIWRLDPGKYWITARSFGAERTPLQSAQVEVDVGESNVDNVELRMVPAFDLQGRIEYEDEQARPNQKNDQKSGFGMSRQFVMQNQGGMSSNVGNAKVAADDSFIFERLQPDMYHIRPTWEGVYVKSMTLGQTPVDGSALDLRNGAAGQTLIVRLSSAVGKLSGIVRDGDNPAKDIRVVLVQDTPFGFTRMANTNANGAYTIINIPPGKYRIVASRGNSMVVIRGKLAEEYEAQAETLEIAPSDQATRDLKLH